MANDNECNSDAYCAPSCTLEYSSCTCTIPLIYPDMTNPSSITLIAFPKISAYVATSITVSFILFFF